MGSALLRTSRDTAPTHTMSEQKDVIVVDNWIGGKWVPPSTGKYLDVIAPATGKVIAKVALSGPEDVQAAVDAARTAFASWSTQTVKKRVVPLIKLHSLLIDNYDKIVEWICLEHGKNKAEALGDIAKGNETVEWAMSLPQLIQGKVLEVSNGVECKEIRMPLGVCGSIVPFNFPSMVPFWTLPICIGVGNCQILKPSEKVPLTMRFIAGLIKEAGIPDGVFQIVNGTIPVVNELCDNKSVDAVTFVGSSKVAEIVAKRCRALNKRVLALGGAKNHLVAMPDCDIEMASQDIVNSYAGCSGQRCMAASALLLVGDQPDLVKAIVDKSNALVPGCEARQLGPVIDEAAQKRILDYISEAEKGGAEILVDGRPWAKGNQGYHVGATVIMHKNAADRALHEEIFGPVLSILKVDSKEEAVRIENANEYGNAAAVYTTRGEHAEWFSTRFSAGMIGVNIGVPVPREPFSFGGQNKSKFGDFDITGDGAMEFFTQRRKITTKWAPPRERTWLN